MIAKVKIGNKNIMIENVEVLSNEFITYKSSSPAGDMISYLAGIRQIWKETGQKAVIYQLLNIVGEGINGVPQPYTNEQGQSIMMGKEMFDNLKPLIEAQEYVESFQEYKGEKIHIDLDQLRGGIFTNQPLGSLNRYCFYAFPQMNCDLSEAWLSAGKSDNSWFYAPPYKDYLTAQMNSKIAINFTFRYRNNFINFFFLKKYEEDILFIGMDNEYDSFCKKWDLNIPKLKTDSFLELATSIQGCKFFLGNASMCFQIAEALKIPRILEIYQHLPNVIPTGKDAYDVYSQSAMEFYVDKLINR